MLPTRTILLASLCLSLAAARVESQSPAAMAGDSMAAQVTRLADQYVTTLLRTFPETATWEGLPGHDHDRLDDNSLAAVRRWQDFEDRLLSQVKQLDGNALTGRQEWVTYGFLREALEASVGTRICRQELWPANQMSGWQVNYASLIRLQPVGTARARAQALARWGQLPRVLRVETANLREGLREGYSTPRHNVELVLAQLDSLLAAPTERSPFFAPAEQDSAPEFRARWTRLLERELRPAIRRYRDFLASEYLPHARDAIAVSAHPQGAACYAARLRSLTSLEWSGAEVFKAGEAGVRERERLAAAIGERLYGTTSLDSIRARQDRLPPSSRDQVLAHTRAMLSRARDSLPRWVGRLPSAEVIVEPMRSYEEATGSRTTSRRPRT